MTDKKQPEALAFCWATELAMTQQPVTLSVTEAREVSAEMQRLHAENTTLQQGYSAARLEIESLKAQAQAGAVPLTPREVELIDGMIAVQLDHATRCDAIANRAMADKQKGWDMERVALLQKLKASHGIKGVQHGTDTRSN